MHVSSGAVLRGGLTAIYITTDLFLDTVGMLKSQLGQLPTLGECSEIMLLLREQTVIC